MTPPRTPLGPLQRFIGQWEGAIGVDLSYHNKEDETAEPDATSITFMAEPGDPTYGLVQNKYLAQRAATTQRFVSTFTINDDGTFSYTSDLVLRLAALGNVEMHHTDRNTLTCTGRDVSWPVRH